MKKYQFTINDQLYSAWLRKVTTDNIEVMINGKSYLVGLDRPLSPARVDFFKSELPSTDPKTTPA